MGQEYFINSQQLQDKVSDLLPSQGGAGSGFDLSASTQIIPIIDLTEQAEGSNVRADIQTAFSFANITHTETINTTNNIIVNTGYFRIFGVMDCAGAGNGTINVTDGATSKVVLKNFGQPSLLTHDFFDFVLFLAAGDSCTAISSSNDIVVMTTTRQIADINGNLINP